MLDVLWWYLTAQAIGLVAFPLAYYLLPQLRDRGYTVSKALGILLLGYASWILSVLHVLPSVRLSIAGLLLAMAIVSARYAWGHRRELKEFLLRQRTAILVGEALFLAFFVGWALFRAYDPAIDHTEQPMDFAFFNAAIQNHVGQPEDPWLRGHSISYYYFGYWMFGAVSELTGVVSSVSYNLSLALVPALAAMAMFGLVYNLIGAEKPTRRYAVFGGLAAVVLLGVVANLEGVLEFMRANAMGSLGFWDWIRIDGLEGPLPTRADSWFPQEHWWWFRATRVINTFGGGQGLDFTIQEFPFFSFMLGDLHPHVMSIPFALLFTSFCWNLLRAPVDAWGKLNLQASISVLAMGLVLGGLAFTNMWDLPTFLALLIGVAVVKAFWAYRGDARRLLRVIVPVAAVIGLAFLLFLPYYLTFASSVTGIRPVEVATTRPVHTLIVWGVFLVAVAPFIIVTFWRTVVTRDWPWLTFVALTVGFVPYVVWVFLRLENGAAEDLFDRFFHVLPLALLIGMAAYNVLWLVRQRGPTGQLFAMVLSVLGLLLIMGPELLFVADSFGNRMNTVFKLYYQAWILLAAASAMAIYYWGSLRTSLSGERRLLTTLWAGAFAVLLVGALYYPPAAAASKGDPFSGDATLDGLAFVADRNPAEYRAIKHLRRAAGRNSAVLEAVGEWFDAGLISRSTGVPTVLNWPGHQIQWRGSSGKLDGRAEDVAQIYQTQDIQLARNLLDKYDVDYVYVGPRERQKYGSAGMDKFPSFMDTEFSEGDVSIYRLRR